jgi:hypothetical protein
MPAITSEARLPDYGALKGGKIQFQQGAQLPDTPLIPAEAFPAYWVGKGERALGEKIGGKTGATLQFLGGSSQGVGEATAGFTTPSNIGLLAAAPFLPEGAIGKVLGTALGGAFEAQQIIHDPEQFKQLKQAWDSGDYGEVARLGSQMFVGHALPVLAPLHAATKGEPVPKAGEALVESVKTEGGDLGEAKNQGGLETQGAGQEEVRKVEPAAAVSGTESPPAAEPPVNDHPVVSAIANKYTQERMTSGDLGEIAPGQGSSVQELATKGQKLVEGGADVDAAVSRVNSGTFDPVDDAAIVRFEEARLRARKGQAYQELQNDPNNVELKLNYENAFKDLTDFHNGPIATVKAVWAEGGRGLQGQFPVDLSTADGLREAWLQNTGKDMPESVRPVAEKVANRVRETVNLENGVKAKLGSAIEDAYAKQKVTHDQIRDRFLKELENRPCR